MDFSFRTKKKDGFHTLFRLAKKQTKNSGFGEMYADLSPSVRLLSVTGIFPVKYERNKKKRFCVDLLCQLTEVVLHFYWLYVFFISFLSSVRLSRQFKTNFTLSLGNALVAIIRFSVYWKAPKVLAVSRSIEIFHLSVSKQGYKTVAGTVRILCCGGTLAAIGMSVISAEHLKVSGMFNSFSQDFILGLNDTSVFCRYFPTAIFASTIFYHHFVPVIICLYICSVFHILKSAVCRFADSLRHDRLEGVPDATVYLSRFIQLTDVVSEVEDLLGMAVFFAFGCLLINQLCVMNSIIVGDTVSTQLVSVMMEFMLSVKNIIIFAAITLSGSAVTEGMENVCSEIRKLALVPGQDFERLSLLLHHVNSSKVSFSAWKIFTLKRSLFLTTTSVMTSYGMLLMQLSQQDKASQPDA